MAYYDYDKIIVFPSANATDSGKSLSESNIKTLVTRITNRNYVIGDSSFIATVGSESVTVSSGIANIQGYLITTTESKTITSPESSGTYILGIKIRKDQGTGNILGDVDGSNVGVDINFYNYDIYKDNTDILTLYTAEVNGLEINLERGENIDYIIDKSIYSKSSGGVSDGSNIYHINQDLNKDSDVIFNSVKTNSLIYTYDNSDYDVGSIIESLKLTLKNLKGTDNWNDPVSKTLNYICDNYVDKSEVVTSPVANKLLKLNSSAKLPCSITGSANSALTATSSTYSQYIGTVAEYYSINQNLTNSSSPRFSSLYIGESTLENIEYINNTLYFNTGDNGFVFRNSNSNQIITISKEGNINSSGTITGTRVYNAVYNDYAEFYEKDNIDEIVNPGDIIEMNPDTKKCRLCTSIGSNMVIGVCSDNYGHILGGDKLDNMEDNNKKYIAIGLSGRVYVNVEDGVNIMPGQLIIASYNGKAMTKANPAQGSVVGKALGYVEKINGIRKILMQIMLR